MPYHSEIGQSKSLLLTNCSSAFVFKQRNSHSHLAMAMVMVIRLTEAVPAQLLGNMPDWQWSW